DPTIDDAVLHVLRDVRGAHEQHLDRSVAARERKSSVARFLGAEPGVLEQVERRLAQPALDRDGDSQGPARATATRYPPSPSSRPAPPRATVLVAAPVRPEIPTYGKPSSTSFAPCQRCAIASSSESVHRSRKNRSPSARVSSTSIASKRSRISLVSHGCRLRVRSAIASYVSTLTWQYVVRLLDRSDTGCR